MPTDPLFVTSVRLTDASAAEVRRGLVGYLMIELGDRIVVDGMTLRRSREGKPYISFPRNQHGYFQVWPLNSAARRDIEHQVFLKLGIAQRVAP